MLRDSLAEQDYSDYSFPNTPTAIVLEKSEDSDFVLPTVPSQKQLDSIHSGEIMPLQSAKPPAKSVTFREQKQAMAVPPPPPPSRLPLITTVYIGSLTVVGLFLLFRMIQK